MSASRWLGLGALGLAAALAGACSTVTVGGDGGGGTDAAKAGDGGGGGPDAMPPDPCSGAVALDDFYTCLSEQVCNVYDSCICAFSEPSHCKDAPFEFVNGLGSGFILSYLHDAIDAGILTYDPNQAGDCIDFLRSATCGDVFASNGTFDQLCLPFSGSVAAGGVCFNDIDCALKGSRCAKTMGNGDVCVAGSCVAPAGLGSDCGTNQLCVPGSYCVQNQTGGYSCQAGNLNALCQGSYQCDQGFYCSPGMTCQPVVGDGSACTDDSQCTPGLQCVGDDVSGTGMCHKVDMAGAPCDGSCDGCLYCDQPQANQLGSCKALPPVGQACANGRCADIFDARCDTTNNTCVVDGDQGDPCTSNGGECRLGLFCTTQVSGNPAGTCELPQSQGSVCNDSQQCATGLCVDQSPSNSLCENYNNCR